MNENTNKMTIILNQNDHKDKTKIKRMILDKMDILTKAKIIKQSQKNGIKPSS